MKRSFLGLMTDSIPTLIAHTHFNFNLQGWPAAFTAVALIGTCVAIYAITVNQFDEKEEAVYEKSRYASEG